MLSANSGMRFVRSTSSPTGIVKIAPTSSETELSSPRGVIDVKRGLELRRHRPDGRGVGPAQRQHSREQDDHPRARDRRRA
jgi:hypothetical protein